MVKWHKNPIAKNERMYVNLTDGRKISMPRYYKDKIYSQDERKAIGYFTRQAMLIEIEKDARTVHEKLQSDIAAFRLMEKKSTQGDKL